MPFKDISYLELWWPLCLLSRTIYAIFLECIMRNMLRNYFEFGLVVHEEMLLRNISYLELWQPFCSAEKNHLCNFGRRYYEYQFCEIILNLDEWVWRKSRLKIFLI